jgi:AraC-like DNA-binding protein
MEDHSKLYTLLMSAWLPVVKAFKASFRFKKKSLRKRSFLGLSLFWSKKPKHSSSYHTSLVISPKRRVEIEATVRKHLQENKSFLQHGYTLKMFSEETQIPVHYLSGFINKYYKMNFNDFINEYRIIFSIDKLLKKEWMYKKLETIANESGFNNRNTFISAFKKVTGVKPSEFLKDIKLGKPQDDIVRNGKLPGLTNLDGA